MGTTIGTRPETVYNKQEGAKFQGATTLAVVECATCGITYAIPDLLNRSALEYHGDRLNGWKLCCPLGHTWWYIGKTELEKAREDSARQRARAGRLAADLDQTKASLRSTKGVVTKQRKKLGRISNGVCPCCNRSFQNLQRHMATKHPGFDPA